MKKILGLLLVVAPSLTYAATTGIAGIITTVTTIISSVIPLMMGVALVYLLWNIVGYIEVGAKDAAAREVQRNNVIWAVVLLFVMVSVWGLVKLLTDTVPLTNTAPVPPAFPTART